MTIHPGVHSMARFVGIDFSGNHKMWTPRCRRSNVWLAEVEKVGTIPELVRLRRVQELAGAAHPFERHCHFLKEPGLTAAAIDAPFSLPSRFLPPGGWAQLLRTVKALPRAGRPFPKGQELLRLATAVRQLDKAKPLRATKCHWRSQRLNVHSTLWNGARGGAPFTAACLHLLAASGLPGLGRRLASRCWSRPSRPHSWQLGASPPRATTGILKCAAPSWRLWHRD
jgi:hypothetical protein